MDINNRKNSMLIVAGVGILFALILVFQWLLGEDEYLLEMEKYRKERVAFFKTNADSPLPDSLRASFTGPEVFPVDKAYRVTGVLQRNPGLQYVEMAVTGAKPERYVLAGVVNFNLHGQALKLTAYQQNENDRLALFIPFRDATSGKETYGGGRYLDTRMINDDKVIMDFNKAYNPYCVYNYSYVCPIPPDENRLPVPVLAGEKYTQPADH